MLSSRIRAVPMANILLITGVLILLVVLKVSKYITVALLVALLFILAGRNLKKFLSKKN